jgi:hypothetical protein
MLAGPRAPYSRPETVRGVQEFATRVEPFTRRVGDAPTVFRLGDVEHEARTWQGRYCSR